MRNHSSVIFVLIIVSSHKLLSFAGGLTFLEKSEEIVNQLLLCSGDVFLHLPFAQQGIFLHFYFFSVSGIKTDVKLDHKCMFQPSLTTYLNQYHKDPGLSLLIQNQTRG